jgi:hypothetical protein
MAENETPRAELAEKPSGRRFTPDEIVFFGLILLSVVGMGISDFSTRYGLGYWLAMVPIFAASSILAVAVYLIFMLQRTGRLNQEDAGLVALIALALTTLLAGVHFDWRLIVLGALLGLTAAAAALVDQYFWVLLIPAVVLAVGAFLWRRRAS